VDTNTWACHIKDMYPRALPIDTHPNFLLTHLNIYGRIPKIHLMKELETDIIEKGN